MNCFESLRVLWNVTCVHPETSRGQTARTKPLLSSKFALLKTTDSATRRLRLHVLAALSAVACFSACGTTLDPGDDGDDSGGRVVAGGVPSSGGVGAPGGVGEAVGGAPAEGGSSGDGAGHAGANGSACPDPHRFNPWIAAEFAEVPETTGDFTSRQQIELPRLIRDASATNAKYAFDLREQEGSPDPRAAFVHVRVSGLTSADAWGAAIQTSGAPNATLFLSNVSIEPNWPAWESYQTTNYDGIVLDGSEALYAENLSVENWNADSALDIKSSRTEFVCLKTVGSGNRTLRFWQAGPHYLVHSELVNSSGAILWFSNCDDVTIYVYESTFNGAPEVVASDVECDQGSDPDILYLPHDPRDDGSMHAMFAR